MTEEKIRQLQKEGRGKGTLDQYLPWILANEFSSKGNTHRIFGHKTGRVHDLFSNVERNLFMLLEFTPDVIDIREQYPLTREDTVSLAAEMGIKHPTYPQTKIPTVMTCDFLVTRLRNDKETIEAFNCKRAEDANDLRAIEKLEIQRRYFNGCGIAHHLVFHSMLPENKIKNIKWIRSAVIKPGEIEPYPNYFKEHCSRFSYELSRTSSSLSLAAYCQNYDERTGAQLGTGLRVIRMLLLSQEIVTNMTEPDLPNAPIGIFIRRGRNELRSVGGN